MITLNLRNHQNPRLSHHQNHCQAPPLRNHQRNRLRNLQENHQLVLISLEIVKYLIMSEEDSITLTMEEYGDLQSEIIRYKNDNEKLKQ